MNGLFAGSCATDVRRAPQLPRLVQCGATSTRARNGNKCDRATRSVRQAEHHHLREHPDPQSQTPPSRCAGAQRGLIRVQRVAAPMPPPRQMRPTNVATRFVHREGTPVPGSRPDLIALANTNFIRLLTSPAKNSICVTSLRSVAPATAEMRSKRLAPLVLRWPARSAPLSRETGVFVGSLSYAPWVRLENICAPWPRRRASSPGPPTDPASTLGRRTATHVKSATEEPARTAAHHDRRAE